MSGEEPLMPDRGPYGSMTDEQAGARATLPLRRLHWRLSLLYFVVSAVAVAALAALVARSDAHLRETQLNAAMQSRVQAAAGLVSFDEGRPNLSDLSADEVGAGSPQVAVLLGTPPTRRVFATAEPRLAIATELLEGVAVQATAVEAIVSVSAEDTGHPVRLVAAPLYNDSGALAGAVVVVGDPAPGAAEHRRLLAALALGCAGLLLVTGTGAHLLAGRSLRPVLVSLEQHPG